MYDKTRLRKRILSSFVKNCTVDIKEEGEMDSAYSINGSVKKCINSSVSRSLQKGTILANLNFSGTMY
jgi:hypothetical protein